MHLVKNDTVVVLKLGRIVDQVVEEDTYCNEGDLGLFGYTRVCSYVVPDQLPNSGIELPGNLGSYVDAGHSSWLGA